jgi:hypothetical protein
MSQGARPLRCEREEKFADHKPVSKKRASLYKQEDKNARITFQLQRIKK